MLNFWLKIHSLPNDKLVKKSPIEIVEIRSSCIQPTEKILSFSNITYTETKSAFFAKTNFKT